MLKPKRRNKDVYSITYFALTIITLVYALCNISKILNWGQFEAAIQLFLIIVGLFAFGLTLSNKKVLAERRKSTIYNLTNAILFAPLPIYIALTFISQIPMSNEVGSIVLIVSMFVATCALHCMNLRINKKIPHLYPVLSAIIFTIAAATSLLSNINTEGGALNWLPFLAILVLLAAFPLALHFLLLRKNRK